MSLFFCIKEPATGESQQRVIEEYRDKVYLECVNVYKINPPGWVAMSVDKTRCTCELMSSIQALVRYSD